MRVKRAKEDKANVRMNEKNAKQQTRKAIKKGLMPICLLLHRYKTKQQQKRATRQTQ